MIERSERQDPEPCLGPDKRRGSSADRPVAAADDHQRIAPFGDSPAASRAIAAREEFHVDIDAGRLKGPLDALGKRRVAGERAAAAVEEDWDARHLAQANASTAPAYPSSLIARISSRQFIGNGASARGSPDPCV